MGVTLYRPGVTHNINGVDCEAQVFDEYSYLHNLLAGWFYSPGECYAGEKEDHTEEEAKETYVILNLDGMSDAEIRLIAKEKKIRHWHNKHINRLKKEVNQWQAEI